MNQCTIYITNTLHLDVELINSHLGTIKLVPSNGNGILKYEIEDCGGGLILTEMESTRVKEHLDAFRRFLERCGNVGNEVISQFIQQQDSVTLVIGVTGMTTSNNCIWVQLLETIRSEYCAFLFDGENIFDRDGRVLMRLRRA